MKKILSFAALLGLINHAFAQNTFPTGVGTNVGINIASPIYPLDVRGDVNIGTLLRFANNSVTTFGTTDAHPTIYSTAATGTAYPFLAAGNLVLQARSSTSARDIVFAGSLTPAVQMIIQGSTGRVGIGTMTPTTLLQINDINTASSTRGNVFIGTTDAAAINAGGQLGFGGSYTGTTQTAWAAIAGRKENATDSDYAGYLQFITRKNGSSPAERARLTSDGSLGIGTTTPGLKTHIFGITGFPATTGTAQTGVLRLQGSSSQAVLDFGVNGGSGSYLQSTNQTALNATYPLLLNPNGGNVGIGTTDTKGYKLAVNGTVVANAMTVKVYPWADYVFSKTHRLPTLTEVKDYIDKNHHLPDMPSAAQVEKDGLNLGEINTVLTKKVEELTLYLINGEKRENDLRSQVNKLQQQLQDINTKLSKAGL